MLVPLIGFVRCDALARILHDMRALGDRHQRVAAFGMNFGLTYDEVSGRAADWCICGSVHVLLKVIAGARVWSIADQSRVFSTAARR